MATLGTVKTQSSSGMMNLSAINQTMTSFNNKKVTSKDFKEDLDKSLSICEEELNDNNYTYLPINTVLPNYNYNNIKGNSK